MRLAAPAFLLGVWLITIFPSLPPMLYPILCVLLFLGLFTLLLCYKKRFSLFDFFKPLILFLLISSSAFLYANIEAHHRLAWQLPTNIEDKSIIVQGTIESIPEKEGVSTTFLFHIHHVEKNILKPVTVKLNWYNDAPSNLIVGDTWQLELRLKTVHGFSDPGAFDYEAYMFSRDIRAQGYIRDGINNKLIKTSGIEHAFSHIRQHIAREILISLPTSPYASMIQALTVGIKNGIQPNQWQVMQRTGTNHLMVIAGLHVGMLSGLIFMLVNFLWRRSRVLPLKLPAIQAATLGALLIALIYSGLAGFSIPTQRALIMITVFMLATLLRRNIPLGLAYFSALLLILMVDPFATLDVGFWLSFAAVGSILYGMNARLYPMNRWWKLGRLQMIISIGVIPFTLLLFQNASIISPIANSIAIPMVGFFAVPFSLLGAVFSFIYFPLANIIWHVAAFILNIVWWILDHLAALPISSWQQGVSLQWTFVTLIFGVLLGLAPRGFPARWLSILLCLPVLIIKPIPPAYGVAKFTLLDVGQGLASVLQTQHHVLVFDTGAKFSADFDLGQAVVVPFLRMQGIATIDKMIISHGDNDHIGGAQSILNLMHVLSVSTSVPERFTKIHAETCLAGQTWDWDGVHFEFLYPTQEMLGQDNNSSCVLRVTAGNESLLMTGDIEKPAEKFIVEHEENSLQANILIAPHHGSKTSSSQIFLNAVQPQFVLFPMGYLNKFHFPNKSVVQRYQSMHVTQVRTDQQGAITLTIGQNRLIQPQGYRQTHKRFWMAS